MAFAAGFSAFWKRLLSRKIKLLKLMKNRQIINAQKITKGECIHKCYHWPLGWISKPKGLWFSQLFHSIWRTEQTNSHPLIPLWILPFALHWVVVPSYFKNCVVLLEKRVHSGHIKWLFLLMYSEDLNTVGAWKLNL